MLKRMKHGPFIALVIDEGRDRVSIMHTTGIDSDKIEACRLLLDELEASL
jgi:hypothetical protein